MSVVAGCSLLNGVMLLADCRVTVERPGHPPLVADNVQKVFSITPYVSIGLVANTLDRAASILRTLLKQAASWNGTPQLNPYRLMEWLPRYCRYEYAQLAGRRPARDVAFMVAGVLRSRPNLVERQRAVDIMERFRLGTNVLQRHWIPGIIVEILRSPPQAQRVAIEGYPLGVIYHMSSPDFVPEYVKPLEWAAIGSGQEVVAEIERNIDWIFSTEVGNDFMESFAFRNTVAGFIARHGIESVGGLYPCVKIDARGTRQLGYSAEIPVEGLVIELTSNGHGQWIQRNRTTGREVTLIPPWEVIHQPAQENRFDDLRDEQGRI